MLLSKLKMEIREIADVYSDTYGSSLPEAIHVNVDGDLQRFLIALLSRSLVSELPPVDGAVGGAGESANSAVAAAIAAENAKAASNTPEEDARRLFVVPAATWITISPETASESAGISGFAASGIGAIASAAGVGSAVDGPLTKMLRDRHLAHIRSAIDAFNADEGIPLSMLEMLEQHQTVDFVEAFKTFLAWLQNPYAFYADKMHVAVVERDAETLTTLLIMRAEDGHMPMVRKMYKKRWINDIVDDLKDAFKGNIGKVRAPDDFFDKRI